MKTKLTLAVLGIAAAALFTMNGCSSTGSAIKCPELASGKTHIPHFANASNPLHKVKADHTLTAKVTPSSPQEKVLANDMKPEALATTDKGSVPIKLKVPKWGGQFNDEEIDKVNTFLGKYSNSHVALVKNEKGRVYVTATSVKEFIKLTKMLTDKKSRAAMSGDNDDIFALVGFICGIVAISVALIPFLDFLSIFPAGPAGVVFGILGLHSSRHTKALIGIILGAVGFALGLGFFIFWLIFFRGGLFLL